MSYKFINPIIKGTIQDSFEAATPLDAAHKAYSTVSQYFSNNLPEFRFSLESAGKYHHFVAKETRGKGDHVDFSITAHTGKTDDKGFKSLLKLKQHKGGKKHHRRRHSKDDDSSDSSDSSDSPYYRRTRLPISSWWYYPNYYYNNLSYLPTLYGDAMIAIVSPGNVPAVTLK